MVEHISFNYFKDLLDEHKEQRIKWIQQDFDDDEEEIDRMVAVVEDDYQSKLRYFELLFIEQKPQEASRLLFRLDTMVRDNLIGLFFG